MIVVVFYADRLRSAAGGSSHLLKKRESFCSSGCKHDPILCQAFFVHPVVRVRLCVGFCCPPFSPSGEDDLIEDSFSRALELRSHSIKPS